MLNIFLINDFCLNSGIDEFHYLHIFSGFLSSHLDFQTMQCTSLVKYFPGIYDFVPGATHIESQAGRHGSHVAVVYHLCWNADCGIGQRVCGAPQGSITKSRGNI